MHRPITLLLFGALALSGCEGRGVHRSPETARATHVDSIVPRAEALRRFQARTAPVDTLAGGARSRGALVRNFVRAIEGRDTTALRRLVLDRSEFAYLYYPTAPQGLPPYDLPPDLLWFTLASGSAKGIARALESFGGRSLGMEGYHCDPTPSRQGDNLVWGPCRIERRAAGEELEVRLFGLILERAGRFKFVTYANGV